MTLPDPKDQLLAETEAQLANANRAAAQHAGRSYLLGQLLEESQRQLEAEKAKTAELGAKVAELTPKPPDAGIPAAANS